MIQSDFTFSRWLNKGLICSKGRKNEAFFRSPRFYGVVVLTAAAVATIALLIIGAIGANTALLSGPILVSTLFALGITVTILTLANGGFKTAIPWLALPFLIAIMVLASCAIAHVLQPVTAASAIMFTGFIYFIVIPEVVGFCCRCCKLNIDI